MVNPNQSQALYEMSQILSGDRDSRSRFERHARDVHIGNLRGGLIGPWRTNPSNDITCIEFMGTPFLLGSLRIAMLKEIIGIGPQRYCIYFSPGPDFYQKLKLIMTYLPREKMFLFPSDTRLAGPFLREPWLSRGRAICARPSLTAAEFYDNFILPFQ